jgi:hypothetical protein
MQLQIYTPSFVVIHICGNIKEVLAIDFEHTEVNSGKALKG